MATYSNHQITDSSSTILYLPNSCSETPPIHQGNIVPIYTDSIHPLNMNTSQQQGLIDFGQPQDNMEMLMASRIVQNDPNLQSQELLSLSLSTQQLPSEWGRNLSIEDDDHSTTFHNKQSRDTADYMLVSVPRNDVNNTYGGIMPSIVLNSKYLKVAQQLLDEVVNVKKAIMEQNAKKLVEKEELGDQPASYDEVISELSKQGLQNKTTKLLSMLDEVDRRYRQYYHQMQIVVSSFDMIAGSGAAKPYTALALQTISRHFRCLRDAINGQLHIVRKKLGVGEEDADHKVVGISRLRYVDQKLKQHTTLHQLRTWRPQRGLPEVSVSILRAWLFEHFLHPYPKDSDKIMLARQTGLTKSQVSNWFINARVRLWKPMVEEMYKEEAADADAEMESNSSSETLPKNTVKTADTQGEDLGQMIGPDTNSSFQDLLQRNYGVEGNQTNESSLFPDESNSNERFMYNMTELERFGNREGVSLTLGLQQTRDNTAAASDLGTERRTEFEPLDSGKQKPHRFMSSLTSFSRLL